MMAIEVSFSEPARTLGARVKQAQRTHSHEDGGNWSGPGPELSEGLKEEVRAVFTELSADFPLTPLPQWLDFASASIAAEEAWGAIRKANKASKAGKGSRLATPDLYRLHRLGMTLAELRMERASEANETLARVLGRLEAAPCSVSDLIRLIPQFICELGFSRGLISRVEGNVWYPELMYVVDDPEWAEELTRLGKAYPQVLTPGLFESELVHTQRSILARNVQSQTWRSHNEVAPASLTRSYVAAPIVSYGEVVGILHGERFGQRRDVDELDRQILACFAEAVRIALSRAALAEALEGAHLSLGSAARTIDRAVAAVHRVPSVSLAEAGTGTGGMQVRSGAAGLEARPLPDTLTRREREVLRLMAAGKSNFAISRQLTIAESTVKQHVKHILRRLLVASRAEAVTRWFQAGGDDALS
jgi:DNA-binding CsgD family transcriptional regulator/GAF domain-containing protein